MTGTAGFLLRRATPADEAGLYEICLRTGDAGQDATPLHTDPRILGEIYVGPYLHLEPELAFALADASGVCGYVLGALETRSFHQRLVTLWLPPLQARHPAPVGDPAAWTATERCRHALHHPDRFCPEPYAAFPSHLHIDLLPRAQGRGHGARMVRHLMDALRARGSPGVHLGLWSRNERAARFYTRLGFHELARPTPDTVYLGRRL